MTTVDTPSATITTDRYYEDIHADPQRVAIDIINAAFSMRPECDELLADIERLIDSGKDLRATVLHDAAYRLAEQRIAQLLGERP